MNVKVQVFLLNVLLLNLGFREINVKAVGGLNS